MSVPPWPPGSYAEAHAEERAKIEAEREATENEPATAMLDMMDLDSEDLACLGLRRANDFMDAFSDLNKQAKEQAWERYAAQLPKPRKPQPPKPPTLAKVAKQAGKAGIDVARYEVKPDGTISVVTGTPESVAPEKDPWPLDEFRTKETKQ